MQEWYRRCLREDMLTMFNRTIRMDRMECSIVLEGANLLNDETKYRAACVLELLTGRKVIGGAFDLAHVDPLYKRSAAETQRRMDEARHLATRNARQKQPLKKGSNNKKGPQVSVSEYKRLSNGFMLRSVVERVNLFYFLEKLREFYLPDTVGIKAPPESPLDGRLVSHGRIVRPPEMGHGNGYNRRGLLDHFQQPNPTSINIHSTLLNPAPWLPIEQYTNPDTAISCYVIRSSDLVKFPDLELNFEAMGSTLSSPDKALNLILRPQLEVEKCILSGPDLDLLRPLPPVDHIRMMNYLLSQFFNPYMHRPRLNYL